MDAVIVVLLVVVVTLVTLVRLDRVHTRRLREHQRRTEAIYRKYGAGPRDR